MVLISLMASTNSSCPPGLVFHHEVPSSLPFKDFPHHLPTPGSRQDLIRPSILSLASHEQDNLLKSMKGLYEYSQFATAVPHRRMALNGDGQDKQAEYVLSFDIDEQWKKRKMLQFLMSGSDELEKDYLDPSIFQDLVRIRTVTADMHILPLVTDSATGLHTPLLNPSGSYYELMPNSDPVRVLSSLGVSDEQLPLIGGLSDVKDVVPVLEEFKVRNDLAWRKQVLVPTFGWTDTFGMQNQSYLPSLTVDYLTTVPLKSPEKAKRKQSSKRKSNSKRGVGDRESYKNNSFLACEMFLSLMMNKKRNYKSITNSLKKAGPALPLLLTQFSASITGTGLAVMFSVIYKVACGSVPFCTSNILVSGISIGLFWLSWAVNKLRDTVAYIGKKSTRLDSGEEEIMVRRVDKSLNDILFRAAALMVVFVLRFA